VVSAVAPGGSAAPATTVSPTSADAVAEVLRQAGAAGQTVAVVGAGTKASWGGSLEPSDVVIRTDRLRGIVRHDAGDLIVTVRAGTALRDVQAVLALSGQRLALSAGAPEATIGGVLAAGEAGPLRLRYGTGRDLLLGVEFVRPDGVRARSGGRVVKNVAGYDVGRLLCGSYGTLGILTEATLRLHPLPAARAWVSRRVESPAEAADVVGAVARSRLVPSAIEVDLTGSAGTLCVLVEGSRSGVAERSAAVAALLGGGEAGAEVSAAEPEWWGRYPFGPGDVALKLAVPLRMLATALEALVELCGAQASVRGSAGSGVLYVRVPDEVAGDAADLAERVAAIRSRLAADPGYGGTCVILAAPAPLRDGLDMWGPVPGLDLMRRVKRQFDPDGRLAAGRFVGGI